MEIMYFHKIEHYVAKKIMVKNNNFWPGKVPKGGYQTVRMKKTSIFIFVSLYIHTNSESIYS